MNNVYVNRWKSIRISTLGYTKLTFHFKNNQRISLTFFDSGKEFSYSSFHKNSINFRSTNIYWGPLSVTKVTGDAQEII